MKTTLLFSLAVLLSCTANSQTADNLYVRSLSPGYDYKAASFVIDSSKTGSAYSKRGLLLWAANTDLIANGLQALSLDQVDSLGNLLSEHVNLQSGVPNAYMQPKKIIRSEYSKSYYLLAHVINSSNPIQGVTVFSTPYVLKLDDNLNLIWSTKIQFSPADPVALIEYNDIMETSDKQVLLVGRYQEKDDQQQALQLAKLDESTGANIWWFWYYIDNYNVNGLSVEEASNGELVATGYATEYQQPPVRELFYAKFKSTGAPLLFRRYLEKTGYNVSGDQISRFADTTNKDHFFITGYIDQDGPLHNKQKQGLVLDISQDGTINSSIHFGDGGDEEINDFVFTLFFTGGNTYLLNLTGYTTSYSGARAYYGLLSYDASGRVFNLHRLDVIKNVYGGQSFGRRAGIEIKYAGPNRFALLLNSSLTTSTPTTYTHAVTNVFIRDVLPSGSDTTCFNVKNPPIKVFKLDYKEPGISEKDPPYKIYDEQWQQAPLISKKLYCGSTWRIYPRLAVRGIPRRNRYNGPGDTVPLRMASEPGGKEEVKGTMLFPNPAESEISFMQPASFNSKLPVIISLYSSDMRVIRSQRASASPVQKVNINDLRPGLYVLQIQQGMVQQSYRFVKK